MDERLLEVARATKGFMPEHEGMALHRAACSLPASVGGPLLEIGTYCGKSSVYLGAAARALGTVLYTVDHHHGSEENQPGWEYHDPSVVDPRTGRMDTLPFFRRTVVDAGLEDVVVGVIGRSRVVAANWTTEVGFLFIDGGHAEEEAQGDYAAWSPRVRAGGLLAIHDVFPDPADGGQAPYHVFLRALDDGFVEDESLSESTLRVLRKPA